MLSAVRRASAASGSRIHAVVGGPSGVGIVLPDRNRILRVVHTEGDREPTGRRRSMRRRQVFESGVALHIALAATPGRSLALYPLVADGTTVGLVEIVAPTRRLSDRKGSIQAIVDQSAEVILAASEKAAAMRTLHGIQGVLNLTGDLLRARTSVAAVRTAAQLCWESLDRPVVGLLVEGQRPRWSVVATPGLGERRRSELMGRIRGIPVRSDRAGSAVAAAFVDVCKLPSAMTIPAGPALLLVEHDGESVEFVQSVAFLLGRALEHRSQVHLARSRNENLDLGIACTAHELRAPLVGAGAALDHLIQVNGHANGNGRVLLERTRDELRGLAELVDPLLRWSAGVSPLRWREVDLVRLTHEAVTSSQLDVPTGRVAIECPPQLWLTADADELRAAISNLLRNALTYSPASKPVTVSLAIDETGATISVKDEGPGVPVAERTAIFDPFIRGRAARSRRASKGLGLFVARRVAEAHGGSLTLKSSSSGALFCLEIPVGDREGGQRFAS